MFGNHDLYAGDEPYLRAFHLPTNSITGTEHFYSFDHGDVHFVGLFLTQRAQAVSWPHYAMEIGSPQYNWLTNDLATTTKPWKIVMGHIPLASSGGRRNDGYLGLRDQLEYQRILLPVFEHFGVQLYLAGHDHIYERLGPMQGVHSLVCGGGGYALYGMSQRDPASARFRSRYSIASLTVSNDLLTCVAMDDFYREIDRFVINLQPPTSLRPTAVWHTPATPKHLDDGDGNLTGQSFDFPETSATAVAGLTSNLGEFCVAADADNLHVGFRHVMLPGSQSLLLFLELPGTTGVPALAHLGDGSPDPTHEGVEALDALEQLSFSDFAPSLACVLGNEFGDTSARSFPLLEADLNPGQGAFWLTTGFPEVPGYTIQQFNESPQITPDLTESRADFITLTIPRRLMGTFTNGSTLKVGAIAGHFGASLTTNEFITLADTGFLGSNLTKHPDGSLTLASITIPLPEDSDTDNDGLSISNEIKYHTDPTNPDSDGDGLQDGWEITAGLDPLDNSGPNGKDGDPDADGFSNHDEQYAGTDPHDPESLLRLVLTPLSPDTLSLRWHGVKGRTYSLLFATSPDGPFKPAENHGAPVSGQDREETVTLGPDATSGCYQLRVTNQ